LDRVPEPPQVVCRGQPRRSRADDQHALAALGCRPWECPALLDRLVAEEALHRVDGDGLVELAAVARALARVVADAAHDRGQRVVDDQRFPRAAVVARFRVIEPALDVFARRSTVIAPREPIYRE